MMLGIKAKDLLFVFVIVPLLLILGVLFFYPAELWLPFHEYFPDWMVASPPYWLMMDFSVIWIPGVIAGMGILFIKKVT